jgi:hypothetical protein
MSLIKGIKGDSLIILSRDKMKYINEFGIEYYINIEMVISDLYDLVIYPQSIKYYKDYLQESQSDNVVYIEHYDEKRKCYIGKVNYKQKFVSNISDSKKNEIINQIKELCSKDGINIKVN